MSAKTVAFQMDPIEGIDILGDSSFALALEAQSRGWTLYHYLPDALSYREGAIYATARPLTLRREKGNHFSFGDPFTLNLREVDVIWLRQDPPFDLNYITTTHLLEQLQDEVLVVNDPAHVRDNPEKLFATLFRDLMPPTLITRSAAEVRRFRADHGDIVVKPLYGNGGAGVFRVRPDDENLNSLIETFQKISREPFMVQRYLPEIRKGDKRIILVDGQPVGAVNRVPSDGEARSNLHVGGTAAKVDLTDRDREICARLGPVLREKGLVFVGIDVIGTWLTEINVTSPTGIQEIDRFNGINIAGLVWDAIDDRLAG